MSVRRAPYRRSAAVVLLFLLLVLTLQPQAFALSRSITNR
jgi:hypothetical protein